MSYRCEVCLTAVAQGLQRLVHTIKKPDGNTARVLAVCRPCYTALKQGVPLATLLQRVGPAPVPVPQGVKPPKPVPQGVKLTVKPGGSKRLVFLAPGTAYRRTQTVDPADANGCASQHEDAQH